MKLLKILITTAITSLFIFPAFSILASEKVYLLELEYNKGSLKLLDINLITGYPNLATDKTSFLDPKEVYNLELSSKTGEKLYQGYFIIPNKIYPVPPQNPGDIKSGGEVGPIILDQVTFGFSLPYFKNGQTIKIAKDQIELLAIDVSKFQMYCGDGKCQLSENENNQTCPEDCVEQKEGPPKPPTGEEGKPTGYIPYLIGIIIAIVILVFLIIKFKKKPESGGTI